MSTGNNYYRPDCYQCRTYVPPQVVAVTTIFGYGSRTDYGKCCPLLMLVGHYQTQMRDQRQRQLMSLEQQDQAYIHAARHRVSAQHRNRRL